MLSNKRLVQYTFFFYSSPPLSVFGAQQAHLTCFFSSVGKQHLLHVNHNSCTKKQYCIIQLMSILIHFKGSEFLLAQDINEQNIQCFAKIVDTVKNLQNII